MPSTKMLRSAGIGYGSRYNFSKSRGTPTPAPCSYEMHSQFKPDQTSKAYSFGIARDAYSKVFIKE